MCCTLSDVSQTRRRMALPKCFTRWNQASAKKEIRQTTEVKSNRLTGRCCCCRWRRWWWGDSLFGLRTLDQDLWVVGDRRRGEGVPSRFGRGTGMWPLIRLGNCGRKQKRWLAGGDGGALNPFPLQHCRFSGFRFFFFFLDFNTQACSFWSFYLHHRRTSRHCFPRTGSGVVVLCVCVF